MIKKVIVLFLLLFISEYLFAGIFSKTLEYNNVFHLMTSESTEDGKMILTVSGLCASSAMTVKKIDVQKKDSKIMMKIKISVFHTKNESGSFKHSIEIPSDVKCVVFGNEEFEIWNVESPFRTELLTKAPKILAGTSLVLNDSQFSETRYEFTSEKKGIVRSFILSYCKKCDLYPDGIIYEENEIPKKFFYDSENGSINIDGEYTGTIALVSKDTYILYNQYEVYCRTVAKDRNIKSAWAYKNRFEKPEYFFYPDKTFRGPFSFPNKNTETNTSEGFEMVDKYEENNSVITLIYSALPSQRFLLHDGNKLYYVYGYLNKTERKVCCGLSG